MWQIFLDKGGGRLREDEEYNTASGNDGETEWCPCTCLRLTLATHLVGSLVTFKDRVFTERIDSDGEVYLQDHPSWDIGGRCARPTRPTG